jgi:hypothetical protein
LLFESLLLREDLFQRLQDIGILDIVLMTIMSLYELVLDHLCPIHNLFYFIWSTIGVKQRCPLLSTLFGIYIDEMESFLQESIQDGDGCLLDQVLISLLSVDDLIHLASSLEGLHR